MTTLIVLFVLGWIICGVLAYGISFAHWQREYPMTANARRWFDRIFSFFFSLFGYAAFLVAFIGSGRAKHGLKFW